MIHILVVGISDHLSYAVHSIQISLKFRKGFASIRTPFIAIPHFGEHVIERRVVIGREFREIFQLKNVRHSSDGLRKRSLYIINDIQDIDNNSVHNRTVVAKPNDSGVQYINISIVSEVICDFSLVN